MAGFSFGGVAPIEMNPFGFGSTGMGMNLGQPTPPPQIPMAPAIAPPTSGQLGAMGVPSGQTPQAVPGIVNPANANPAGVGGSGPDGFTGIGGFFRNPDGSMNLNNIGMLGSGLQALGGFWNTFQQTRLARDSMNMQRESWETNLQNQEQTYNTSLEDKIRSRYAAEGRSSQEADDYLKKHQL